MTNDREYRVLDTDGNIITTVDADCIENADYAAQAKGYDVIDWAEPDAVVVRYH